MRLALPSHIAAHQHVAIGLAHRPLDFRAKVLKRCRQYSRPQAKVLASALLPSLARRQALAVAAPPTVAAKGTVVSKQTIVPGFTHFSIA